MRALIGSATGPLGANKWPSFGNGCPARSVRDALGWGPKAAAHMNTISDLRAPEPLPPNVARHWEWHFRTLLSIRERLRQSRAEIALGTNRGEYDPENPSDPVADQATNESAQASAGAAERLLADVEDAIQRLYRGTYGRCEATGLPIPEERLRAVPWCRYVVSAEREHEKAAHNRSVQKGVPF